MDASKPMSLDRLSDAIDVLIWFSEQLQGSKNDAEAMSLAMMTGAVNLTLSSYAASRSRGSTHEAAVLAAVSGEMPIPPHVMTSVRLQMTIAENQDLKNGPPAA